MIDRTRNMSEEELVDCEWATDDELLSSGITKQEWNGKTRYYNSLERHVFLTEEMLKLDPAEAERECFEVKRWMVSSKSKNKSNLTIGERDIEKYRWATADELDSSGFRITLSPRESYWSNTRYTNRRLTDTMIGFETPAEAYQKGFCIENWMVRKMDDAAYAKLLVKQLDEILDQAEKMPEERKKSEYIYEYYDDFSGSSNYYKTLDGLMNRIKQEVDEKGFNALPELKDAIFQHKLED